MTHFAMRNQAGNYILNREIDKSVTNGNTRIDDQRLEEITPELDVVWSWNLFEHVPPSGTKEELCHANHLQIDEAGGFLYYNCRWVGLIKIERASGEYDATSLGAGDFTFNPPASQFSDAHEPEFGQDGTLMLYDNGGYVMGGGGGQDFHSRILEYRLDETNMVANLTWEFPGNFAVDSWYTDDWYTPFWGDVDIQPNGNVLVTAGVRSSTNPTRFFEVTREGEVVWELRLPANNGSYKAARLSPPPLVEAIP
jgi:hypothetical protein